MDDIVGRDAQRTQRRRLTFGELDEVGLELPRGARGAGKEDLHRLARALGQARRSGDQKPPGTTAELPVQH